MNKEQLHTGLDYELRLSLKLKKELERLKEELKKNKVNITKYKKALKYYI